MYRSRVVQRDLTERLNHPRRVTVNNNNNNIISYLFNKARLLQCTTSTRSQCQRLKSASYVGESYKIMISSAVKHRANLFLSDDGKLRKTPPPFSTGLVIIMWTHNLNSAAGVHYLDTMRYNSVKCVYRMLRWQSRHALTCIPMTA